MRPACLAIPLLALVACSQAPGPAPADSGNQRAPAAREVTASPQAPVKPQSLQAPVVDLPPPKDPASLARSDGYGALRFGMSEAQVRSAWEGELKGDKVEADNCAYLRPKGDTDFRVGFMFEAGKLVRYDVNIESETAPGGGRVGQRRADIERLYAGRVEVQPHEYVPGGNYLRVEDPAIDGGALVFETDEKGRVTRWRVGRAPQVDYVEGCA